MKYEEIQRISATLKAVDVKGKEYIAVNQRVIAFRKLFPEGAITTDLIHFGDGVCVVKATIRDGDRVLATGLAYEKEGSTYINKTSYLENCETSSVGRALGFLGIGIEDSIASAEEVETAVINQATDRDIKQLDKEIDELVARLEPDPALRTARKDKYVAAVFKGKRYEQLTAPERTVIKIRLAKLVAELPKTGGPGIKTVQIGNQTAEVIN